MRRNSSNQPIVSDDDTISIFVAGLERLIRYPFVTVASATVSCALCFGIAELMDLGYLNHASAFVVGSVAGILLALILISLCVMDPDSLPDMGRLYRSIVVTSLVWGVGLSVVPLITGYVLLKFLTVGSFQFWIDLQAPFFYSAAGPVMLFGMLPAMLIAWPTRAKHDTELKTTVYYVWQNLQGRQYKDMSLTLLIAAFGGFLASTPVAALLAPAIVVQLSTAAFERLEGNIHFKD